MTANLSATGLFALPRSVPKRIALLLLAVLIIHAGVAHFLRPDGFADIMPPYLPAHLPLVYVSGIFEILGGIGVIFSRTRRLAGWGLIALLIAVFPANVHMALSPDQFASIPVWALFARLPLQFVFLGWVWWATLTEPPSREARLMASP